MLTPRRRYWQPVRPHRSLWSHRRGKALAVAVAFALVLVAATASSALADESHNTVEFSCTAVTFNFTGFPNANNNTVHEIVFVDGKEFTSTTFKFNGPTGSNTIVVAVPPGHHSIDGRTHWVTNGAKGGADIPHKGGVTCAADPAFSIEKLQKFATSKLPFTTSTLATGHVGETVDYSIVVKNTGNVPLTFSSFTDEKCDPGTITGGPGLTPVAPGGKTTYLCNHVLTEADHTVGFYTNTASDTGTPPENEGSPIAHESNTVVVELPTPTNKAEFSCQSVTFTFTGFPNLTNTVTEIVFIDGKRAYTVVFTFTGTSGSNTVKIVVPPGHHSIDGRTKWNTNTFKGGLDIPGKGGVKCTPEPGMSIEKRQEIGGGLNYTTAPIIGKAGQTVNYRMVVSNSGNVPLTLSNFTDEHCDPGTISGGAAELPPETSTIYFCTHLLSEADQEAEIYENTASETGTPPEGDGPPLLVSSNTVIVELPKSH
jgi:hypothetical protein